jgi:hypothetical protein
MVEAWKMNKEDLDAFIEGKPKKVSPEEANKMKRFAELLNKMEYQDAKQQRRDLRVDLSALPINPFTWLKFKLFRSKGWAWVLKCYANGGVKLLFVKNPKEVFFGKKQGDFGKKATIKNITHWLAGNPLHIVVEGMPVNVSLNKEIKISELSPHIDASITYAHHIGIIRGMKQKISGVFSNPMMVIFLILALVAAFAAAYFAFQSVQSIQAMQGTLDAVLAAGG